MIISINYNDKRSDAMDSKRRQSKLICQLSIPNQLLLFKMSSKSTPTALITNSQTL